ncbi:type II toxin-antitoxin system VapC family toxin [Paraburkholderia sp. CNPSo 3274]|uniref:type II toxin-antitoxin system VapC family toxin n=1 Tax=Paraburkholderia sp. CNPSo 3274 TaxID=2940932 RepID=UPI0020B73EB2|nr:type II toxin-antitoxin system VapC family toxin [Paraburkholderia sp. CNPSo 3274]MCP3711415.1 type II toxin-antitoxin system VapC family toxin [Paraburkholderia sp. CNPSo 3274]
MKLLLDTHLLIWAAADHPSLPDDARAVIEDEDNTLYFSVASMWEIVIKSGLGRDDFQVDARVLRRNLLDAGYEELSIESQHAFEVATLPGLHRDPFDRLLIGQAIAEGIVLLTHDEQIRRYDFAPVRYV